MNKLQQTLVMKLAKSVWGLNSHDEINKFYDKLPFSCIRIHENGNGIYEYSLYTMCGRYRVRVSYESYICWEAAFNQIKLQREFIKSQMKELY